MINDYYNLFFMIFIIFKKVSSQTLLMIINASSLQNQHKNYLFLIILNIVLLLSMFLIYEIHL
jgi:hypothetical protein